LYVFGRGYSSLIFVIYDITCLAQFTDFCIAASFHVIFDTMQVSSSSLFRPSGSARRVGAVSNSRDAVVGSEIEPSLPLAREGSPGALLKTSGAQRNSPITSSEHKGTSSGRNTSNIKNFESTLRGIESLSFNDEKVQY
jgi:casein kinase 1